MHKTCSPSSWIWKRCRLKPRDLESDLSLILSPQPRKSEPLMCRLTSCAPSPCEVFTEQQSLWPAPLLPPAVTWLFSRGLTGGTLRLSTHCFLTEPYTHTFLYLWFQSSWPLFPHNSRTAHSSLFLKTFIYPRGPAEQLPTGSVWEVKSLAQGQLGSRR